MHRSTIWYHSKGKDRQIAHVAKYRSKLAEGIKESKMRPCMDCGFVPEVSGQMDYDHLRDKEFNVSKGSRTGSPRKIAEEISKCDLVCRNCHALRTHNRRHAPVDQLERSTLF